MNNEDKNLVKRAMVAAATAALEHKQQNPKATDDDAIRYVVKISDELLREIGI